MTDGPAHLVGLDAIRRAAARIRPAARRTPLIDAPFPGAYDAARGEASSPPGRVWLKAESLQHVGAFKLRGAFSD